MDLIFDDEADEVGSEVEAFCPKCKADTNHIVMFKYEDEIRKVECKSCGDVHAFRKPRGEVEEEVPEPLAAKKRAAKVKPTWDQVMAKAKKEPKIYSPAERYNEMEILSHPTFGVGFVSEAIGSDKIEVTFQAERRTLAHNRKGMSLPPSAYAHPVDTTIPGRDRKAAVKQAAQKSAAAKKKKEKEAPVPKGAPAKAAPKAEPARAKKKAQPVAKAKPAAAPVRKPDPKKAATAARPSKTKPSRAAAPVRSKPAAKSAKAPAGKKVKKR